MLVENHCFSVIALSHIQKAEGSALPLSWETPISVQDREPLFWRLLGQVHGNRVF